MEAWLADPDVTLYHGDCLEVLRSMPDASVQCCVTSPPYWGLRDYGVDGQLGLEATPDEYVAAMVAVFAEVRRVLSPAGTLWLNLGDSYSHGGNGTRDAERWPKQSRNDHRVEHPNRAGGKPKDMVGIPWRVAFALQQDGWWLRSDIIWSKPNPMPESVTDRPTKAHEYVFLLSKSASYYFDQDAVREPHIYGKPNPMGNRNATARRVAKLTGNMDTPRTESSLNPAGRNVRSVWEIPTQPFPEAHFAVFPMELARRCILAGSPEGGAVLDPFAGSGTTCLVARNHQRRSVGIELNEEYLKIASGRLAQQSLLAGG